MLMQALGPTFVTGCVKGSSVLGSIDGLDNCDNSLDYIAIFIKCFGVLSALAQLSQQIIVMFR